MPPEASTARAKSVKSQNKAMIKAAFDLSKGIKARHLFLYIDPIDINLIPGSLPKGVGVILVSKQKDKVEGLPFPVEGVLTIPKLKVGRMGIIKISVILALSAKLVNPDETVVFLVGKTEQGLFDILLALDIGKESEILTGTDFSDLPETVKPAVFEHTLNLAVQFAPKTRERKPKAG